MVRVFAAFAAIAFFAQISFAAAGDEMPGQRRNQRKQ